MTTAIKKYLRLEAQGVWRPSLDEQRRDVVVKLGEASLVILDFQDRPLTHWSLPAVRRLNPGQMPAIFATKGALDEQLELGADSAEMISAIARLSRALDRGQRGRLRKLTAFAASVALMAAIIVFVPDAMRDQAAHVNGSAQRVEIGEIALTELTKITGPVCTTSRGNQALSALAQRVAPNDPPRLLVVPELNASRIALPGNLVVLDRSLFDSHESPDYVAGELTAELITRREHAAFEELLGDLPFSALTRFLTSGSVPKTALTDYISQLQSRSAAFPRHGAWVARMRAEALPMQGWVDARRRLGGAVPTSIEQAAGLQTESAPVLNDQDWLSLQRICE